MKNVNFPCEGLPSIDELNELFQDMLESSGNSVNYMMKIYDDKELISDFAGMIPDTYGC